ncbi:class I SAM-dependent methyltransferase [Metabacillus herbersteinensis]|uniref:Class I SAM-dependent methyltransferase n=1 Tax=Metabacillus herbersteinensis TaxID=283816 RepID=A0ABV6GCR9_9BACI
MLDLGCGTGQLALRFSDWSSRIVGIDPELEMIKEAKRLGQELRIENIEWFNGDLIKYKSQYDDTFRMVTIVKAFHWMEREAVLDTLYEMISYGGGVAIIDEHYSPDKEPLPWQRKVNEVVSRWYGDQRRAGNTIYSHPKTSHEEVIAKSRFDIETLTIPTYEQIWTVDTIIGNIYSTSYGSKRFLGENAEGFERDLREELLFHNNNGVFKEPIILSIKLALKK